MAIYFKIFRRPVIVVYAYLSYLRGKDRRIVVSGQMKGGEEALSDKQTK
jgi:hypothetical protein